MPWTKPYLPSKNQRLDLELYAQTGRVTFMTVRAYNHQVPFNNPDICQMIINVLRTEQARLGIIVYTYCLMPDHLHYLNSPQSDGKSVLTFNDQFKGKTTNQSWKLGWQGKLWQPRSYDHLVRAEEDLREIAKYILNNPVRAGLVTDAEQWPWSGHLNPLPL